MKASVCLLCDRATVREGLLHILGGGISRLGRPVLPAPMDVDLALLLAPDNAAEVPGEHWIEVRIRSDEGAEIVSSRIGYRAGEVDPDIDPLPTIPLPVGLRNVAVATYGHYAIQVTYDGNQIAGLRFVVEKQPPQGITQQVTAGTVP